MSGIIFHGGSKKKVSRIAGGAQTLEAVEIVAKNTAVIHSAYTVSFCNFFRRALFLDEIVYGLHEHETAGEKILKTSLLAKFRGKGAREVKVDISTSRYEDMHYDYRNLPRLQTIIFSPVHKGSLCLVTLAI